MRVTLRGGHLVGRPVLTAPAGVETLPLPDRTLCGLVSNGLASVPFDRLALPVDGVCYECAAAVVEL